MIERIEALCNRLNDENLWGLDSDDEALERTRQLLPLLAEVAKAAQETFRVETRLAFGEDTSADAEFTARADLLVKLCALESWSAEHLPEVAR